MVFLLHYYRWEREKEVRIFRGHTNISAKFTWRRGVLFLGGLSPQTMRRQHHLFWRTKNILQTIVSRLLGQYCRPQSTDLADSRDLERWRTKGGKAGQRQPRLTWRRPVIGLQRPLVPPGAVDSEPCRLTDAQTETSWSGLARRRRGHFRQNLEVAPGLGASEASEPPSNNQDLAKGCHLGPEGTLTWEHPPKDILVI